MHTKAFPTTPVGRLAVAAAALALCSAGTVQAGQGQQQTQQQSGSQQQGGAQQQASSGQQGSMLPEAYKTSNWIGKQVRNSQGEKLGKVKELVMDDWGVLRYVVMETDKLQGKKDQLVAVPMGHFSFPLTAQDHLVFETDQSKLQAAPTFSSNQWPNMGEPTWSSVVIAYWVPEDAQQQGSQQAAPDQQGQQSAQQGQQSWQAGQQPGTLSGSFAANRDMIYLSKDKEQLFKQLDANSDGAIDKQEAQSNGRVSQRFDQIDSYGNDRITRSEFAAFEPKQGGQSPQGDQAEQGGQSQQ